MYITDIDEVVTLLRGKLENYLSIKLKADLSSSKKMICFAHDDTKPSMSLNPKTISTDTLAITALETMEKYNITSLFVYSSNDLKKPDGIVHISQRIC